VEAQASISPERTATWHTTTAVHHHPHSAVEGYVGIPATPQEIGEQAALAQPQPQPRQSAPPQERIDPAPVSRVNVKKVHYNYADQSYKRPEANLLKETLFAPPPARPLPTPPVMHRESVNDAVLGSSALVLHEGARVGAVPVASGDEENYRGVYTSPPSSPSSPSSPSVVPSAVPSGSFGGSFFGSFFGAMASLIRFAFLLALGVIALGLVTHWACDTEAGQKHQACSLYREQKDEFFQCEPTPMINVLHTSLYHDVFASMVGISASNLSYSIKRGPCLGSMAFSMAQRSFKHGVAITTSGWRRLRDAALAQWREARAAYAKRNAKRNAKQGGS